MRPLSGLTVRWSLVGLPDRIADELTAYVEGTSHAGFEGKQGLAFKTWRMRRGEWFEGCYVFADDAARAAFEAQFAPGADRSPGSKIIGAAPILIEPCEIVAIAEGAAGFASSPAYDRD